MLDPILLDYKKKYNPTFSSKIGIPTPTIKPRDKPKIVYN